MQIDHTNDINTLESVCNGTLKYNLNIETDTNRMKVGSPAPNLYLVMQPYRAIYLPYLY